MGRKGVSKRKPKKNKSKSNDNNGASNARGGERSPVQSLMDDKSAPLNRGRMNPTAGSHKSQKKQR